MASGRDLAGRPASLCARAHAPRAGAPARGRDLPWVLAPSRLFPVAPRESWVGGAQDGEEARLSSPLVLRGLWRRPPSSSPFLQSCETVVQFRGIPPSFPPFVGWGCTAPTSETGKCSENGEPCGLCGERVGGLRGGSGRTRGPLDSGRDGDGYPPCFTGKETKAQKNEVTRPRGSAGAWQDQKGKVPTLGSPTLENLGWGKLLYLVRSEPVVFKFGNLGSRGGELSCK